MKHDDYKGHGRAAVIALALIFVGGIALQWGWNTFAAEILGQSTIKYKHALAAEILLFVIATPFVVIGRIGKAR